MYEVGGWFPWLLNSSILAFVAFIAIVLVLIKRNQYAKQAAGMIRAEIQLPTGWSEYHTVPLDIGAKSVSVGNFTYMLNPSQRRYGRHPMNPFMGLSWLQVPIRIESWAKDDPEPVRPSYDQSVVTAAEIKAMTREIQATTAAMQIQEIEARQKELTNAIANQPNKMIVYAGLGLCALGSIVCIILVLQSSSAVGG